MINAEETLPIDTAIVEENHGDDESEEWEFEEILESEYYADSEFDETDMKEHHYGTKKRLR